MWATTTGRPVDNCKFCIPHSLDHRYQMIRKLSFEDVPAIHEVINRAACAYKGIIPEDCYHEPYMSEEQLIREMKSITFFGWEENNKLVGVMGFQPAKDVTLIRHAYVLPYYQRKGIGSKLLDYLRQITRTRYILFVGTWADATWAIKFYQNHGFRLMPDKDKLLVRYWNTPRRQVEASVVLGLEK